MLVLALDTATPAVTAGFVVLARPHELSASDPTATDPTAEPIRVLAEQTHLDAFGHAERLMPAVTAAARDAGASLAELDAIVVGAGPGPFTGLRVGIVTAEALGDGLDRPVYGVPSHDGVAAALAGIPGLVLVVTDARRREVYVSAYDGRGARVAGPAVLTPAALPEWAAALPQPPVAMAGRGVELTGLDLPVLEVGRVSGGLVRAAASGLVTGAVPGPVRPLYLRRPDVTEPGQAKSVLR